METKAYPKVRGRNNIVDIDPFTIFGLFNKGITNTNKISILQGFAQEFSVQASVPNSFDGIPVLNNMAATFITSSEIVKKTILKTCGKCLYLRWNMRIRTQRACQGGLCRSARQVQRQEETEDSYLI